MLKESLFLKHLKDYALRYSPNIISYSEPNGNYIYVNQTAEKLLGYKSQELIGKNFYPLIHPDDVEHIEKKSHAPVLKGEIVEGVKYRVKKSDGNYIWLDSQVIPVKEKGVIKKVITISRPVEEDERLKEDLKIERKINNEICEIANIGHWSYEINSGKIIWSKKIYEIHGIPIGEPVDLDKAMDFYSEDSKRKIRKGIREAIDKGLEYRLKLRLIDGNGKRKWVKAVGTPLMKRGKCIQIFGTFQDVTDLEKNTNTKIFSLSEYLEGQNHLLKEFSQITSHDLRGPAIGLQMLVDEVKKSEDENIKNLIPYFDENLKKLFDKLDYLSQITASPVDTLENKKINISRCIDRVLKKNEELILDYDITVTKDCSDWSKIAIDKSKIERILQNLIENAVYFSDPAKEEKRLKIRTYSKDNQRHLNIEDNGIGMDLQKLGPNGFTRNSRLHDQLSGNGSGIFMAKILLESSKGKMDFISKPGRGTAVRLNFDKYRFKEDLL